MSRHLVLVLSAILMSAVSAAEALAVTGSMRCSNPRRQYVVRYDSDEGIFIAEAEEGKMPYTVHSIQIVGSGAVFKGETPNGGPTFEAYTAGRKRIRFYIDGELLQTDFCK